MGLIAEGKANRVPDWSEVFAALDRAGVPEDFLADRDWSLPQERETVMIYLFLPWDGLIPRNHEGDFRDERMR